ncbi:MAG: SpoIVB peptidase [Paenibacillus macerans]|uniref:SpoIVB peptidase n=2 Tax=Paenibacillus macerans TaxID=44252 RepID=A0A6N8EW67_PAEMA|nr:SpoIVB peptidase [Paenibacillus macerans]MBS5909313.1 SpoIVB peptidase [Paenibacillus macerans]MCY7557747.1 SpoIVB peptidase [Paenibacillus macerans]MDU7472021.1 SpoIVB peptidase [Paenibacillus macerans]MEC0141300.1 SpoIVB peptidase [Paenibacillus macerans]MEC0155028.1 SpoIVB peptidase [Paenibacillus macerans]
MNPNLRKRMLGLLLAFFFCFIGTSAAKGHAPVLPDQLRLFQGQGTQISLALPVQAEVSVDRPDVIRLNGQPNPSMKVSLGHPLKLSSLRSGEAKLRMKLFGQIPLKTVKVNVIPDLKVIPGGQTIGVKVKSAGILVVGHHQVLTDTSKLSPGEAAGIEAGDLITHINGIKLKDVRDVAEIAEAAGKSKRPMQVTYQRDSKEYTTSLTPAFDKQDRAWRLGLYIRDSAAGVGTLTFYAPEQGVYGALGHIITDMNTQTPIVVGSGQILQSSVTSISKSESGEPGEKRAHFLKEGKMLGTIERNTHFGIFGKMSQNPEHSVYQKPVPVAFAEEVKEGPAEILTVVEGQRVERFKVEIVHVSKQSVPETKGLVLRITDPRLVEKTGGIVQGMSGSPIMQNGKLIGAVTHVFVNDPKSGYGCFIEWMLQDAGILERPQNTFQNLKAS